MNQENIMDRKTFFKEACKMGLCTCTGLALLFNDSKAEEAEEKKPEEPSPQQKQITTMQTRFANLISIMDEKMADEDKEALLIALGNACADQSVGYYSAFAGDPEGFVAKVQESWAESAEYNKEEKTVVVRGKKQDKCGCAMVDNDQTPKSFCNCSRGWMETAFGVVMGTPVKATIQESVLQGGERCTFLIKAV